MGRSNNDYEEEIKYAKKIAKLSKLIVFILSNKELELFA